MANNNLFIIILLTYYLTIQILNGSISKDCGSKYGRIINAEFCGGGKKCILRRGHPYEYNLTFYVTKQFPKLFATFYGKILAVEVAHVTYNKQDTCKEKTLSCPLRVGQNYTFTDTQTILQQYPKIRFDLIMKLTSPDNEIVICHAIPAQIQ